MSNKRHFSKYLDPKNPEEVDFYRYKNETPQIDPKILSKLKKTKMGKVGNFTVYMVDDEYIRGAIDVDFVLAGNFGRDAYVPENEIWISNLLKPSDYGPTLLHEAVEVYLMTKHNVEYDKAHDFANLWEKKFRRKILSKELKIKTQKDAFREANKLVKQFLMDAITKIK